jgi:hypothetical protein
VKKRLPEKVSGDVHSSSVKVDSEESFCTP